MSITLNEINSHALSFYISAVSVRYLQAKNHQCFYDIYHLKHKNTLFVGKQESIGLNSSR